MTDSIPAHFRLLRLRPAGFIEANGPLYGAWEDGRFVQGFLVEARHCNPVGTCHGGMLATLADMLLAMGSNLEADLSCFLLTVSLTCDFLGTVPEGVWLEGRVDVLRITSRLVFSQGILAHGAKPVLRLNGILRRPAERDQAFAADRILPREGS